MSELGKTIALIQALKMGPTDAQVTAAVDDWLDDHPDATTTVTDGSITNAKLATSFVTPGSASAYSSSATYAVGDYVFYNGALYRCTTPITTAEAWTAAHWTAAVLGDDVGELKSAINCIETSKYSAWESGNYKSSDGTKNENTSRIRNTFDFGITTGCQNVHSENGFEFCIYAWDASGAYQGSYHTDGTFQTNGTNVAFVTDFDCSEFPSYHFRVSIKDSAGSSNITTSDGANIRYQFCDDTLTKQYKAADAKKTGDEIANVKSDLNTISTITKSPNLYNPNDADVIVGKYINPNGTVESVSGRTVTGFIPVTPDKKITFSSNGDWATWASTCFYGSNKTSVISGGTYNGYLLTVPQNAAYVRVTFASTLTNIQVECNTGTISPYQPYGDVSAEINDDVIVPNVKQPKTPFEKKTGDLSDGGFIKLPVRTNVRKNNRVVFTADITTFSSITIAKSSNVYIDNISNPRNKFVIDGTNISYYFDGSTLNQQQAHGLTITNNIQVIIEEGDETNCKVTLISNGSLFAYTFSYRIYENGAPFVLSTGSTLTGCEFVWTCADLNKIAWIFGDSYVQYSDDRWPYYLHQYGFDKNALIDGYAGESSASAYPSFEALLNYGTPDFAIWCIGMNDSGDSGSTPSANWVTGRDKFLKFCALNRVTPIFGTIPTVSTVNNEAKNTWIRESEYRYIDFAKAVGAQSDGTWFTGMLAQDGVHPTAKGARALFAQFLADFPEIMVGN